MANPNNPNEVFLLLGAEGYSEATQMEGHQEWLRDATSLEYDEWKAQHGQCFTTVSQSGRPYFLVAVRQIKAPTEVAEIARKRLATLRFE